MGSVGANRNTSGTVENIVRERQSQLASMTKQEKVEYLEQLVEAQQYRKNRGEDTSTVDAIIEATRNDLNRSNFTAGIERQIDKKSFTNEGGGQWTMDIEGVGGGQILDERDSSRAGFGSGPAYGITIWDKNYKSEDPVIYYGSLNEAKQEFKRRLKGLATKG